LDEHEHGHDEQAWTDKDARRLESKVDLMLELLCSQCRPAALLRLHPTPAPIPGIDDSPAPQDAASAAN